MSSQRLNPAVQGQCVVTPQAFYGNNLEASVLQYRGNNLGWTLYLWKAF